MEYGADLGICEHGIWGWLAFPPDLLPSNCSNSAFRQLIISDESDEMEAVAVERLNLKQLYRGGECGHSGVHSSSFSTTDTSMGFQK